MALRRAGGRSAAGNELARSVSWREAKATIGRPELAVPICATRRLRCGWHLALIRKWSSEYWGTPQLL